MTLTKFLIAWIDDLGSFFSYEAGKFFPGGWWIFLAPEAQFLSRSEKKMSEIGDQPLPRVAIHTWLEENFTFTNPIDSSK